MTKINISDLKVGMIIKEPVFNVNGSLLINQDALITDKHINIFKKWGILEVDVKGDHREELKIELSKNLSPKDLSNLEIYLDSRFKYKNNDPVMEEILRITKKIYIEYGIKPKT